ncbi:MAG: TatD family hydrolase [Verrucomicrobiota bacterium]
MIDAHCHLQDPRLGSLDVATLPSHGIDAMVVNGTCPADWTSVSDLAHRYPGLVLPAFGLHPWNVGETRDHPAWEEELRELLRRYPHASVGEIGLDRWKNPEEFPGQEDAFRRQLSLAETMNRPASIHCLRAWGPLVDCLEERPTLPPSLLLHSFGGSLEIAERLLQLPTKVFFSFAGYFLRTGKQNVRDVFRQLPLPSVLLETDAPDQRLPENEEAFPLQDGERNPINHPGNLSEIYRAFAKLRNMPSEDLHQAIDQNARSFLLGRLGDL